MSAQHTPGPWAVHPTAKMAVHQPELGCWIPQNEADARLIAAAPELLEALKACAAVCAGEAMSKKELVDALEKARDAIAKATGDAA